MERSCGTCKHGHEKKPDGHAASPGTVWCARRAIQMAKHRDMPCFVPLFKQAHTCMDCKRAKITLPSGGATQLGNVWCERKKIEIHKKRNMDCFE